MTGVSKSGSKEIVSKCQLVGPFGRLRSFSCASAKLLDIRGQKLGKGQRVKMNVIARACPLNCLVLTACPSSLVKWYCGSGSPTCKGATSRTKRNVPRDVNSVGAGGASLRSWSIQTSELVTVIRNDTASPAFKPVSSFGSL